MFPAAAPNPRQLPVLERADPAAAASSIGAAARPRVARRATPVRERLSAHRRLTPHGLNSPHLSFVRRSSDDSLQAGVKVTLQPFGDSMGGLSAEELQEQVLAPYFAPEGDAAGRPVHEGDRLRIRKGAQVMRLI